MSFDVMNNTDLRGVIWGYLRKEPKIKCFDCHVVCVWDKKIINFYYTEEFLDKKKYTCINCYWTNVIDICVLC